MDIYKRIVILMFFVLYLIKAEDTLKSRKHNFFLTTGVSYFNINDGKDRKYYDGEFAGIFVTGGYERKYIITEVKYQLGISRDALYHFGEWNIGAKVDFLKRHGISFMTGIYIYRTQSKINLFLENLPVYDLTISPTVPIRYHNINYPFYQGGSNFMIMDISNGKFKWAGTNLFYMLWMHLKAEYFYNISRHLNLSLSGSTYFSNSINKFVSLHTLEDVTSEQQRYYQTMPTKYILNESGSGLPVYENTSYGSKNPNYFVPHNILFNVNLSIKYKF